MVRQRRRSGRVMRFDFGEKPEGFLHSYRGSYIVSLPWKKRTEEEDCFSGGLGRR